MSALWSHFGPEPFERGNLDAGRLNWLLDREVVAVEEDFDPVSYDSLLRIDEAVARVSFTRVFEAESFDDWDEETEE